MPINRVRLQDEEPAGPRERIRLHEPTRERVRLEEPRPKKRKKAAANRTFLTEDKVAALPAKTKDYLVWDAGGRGAIRGLHVHVLPTGTKTYRYSFRFKGAAQAISYKLGRWPGLPLNEARAKAQAAEKAVAKGLDPRASDPANSDAFGAAVEAWHHLEQVGQLGNISADGTKNFVLHHTKSLKHRPVGEITYREIDTLLAKIRDVEKKAGAAIRLHSHLKSLFRWCVRTQRIERSPIADMPSPAPEPQPREREWFNGEKADAFIKKLWRHANAKGSDVGRLLKLLVITGKRRNIVQTMRWEAIDKDWYWTPPKGSRSKRNNPIPLPKLAQRVLGTRPEGGGCIFAVRIDDNDMWELAKRLREAVEPTYFHHGIRHVVTTKLAELKTPPHIARLLLDHAPLSDVHSGYEHVDWRPEMLEALERKDVAVLR